MAEKYNSNVNNQLSIVFTTPWNVGGSIALSLGTIVLAVTVGVDMMNHSIYVTTTIYIHYIIYYRLHVLSQNTSNVNFNMII